MFDSRKFAVGAAVLSMLVLTACGAGKEPEKSAEEVVNEGISNLYSEVNSASFEFDFTVDADMPNEPVSEVSMSLGMSGAMDNSDPSKPKFNLVVDGNAATGGEAEESVSGEIRVDEDMAYMIVNEVPSLGGQIPAELVEPFVGKWFSVEIPEGSLDTVAEIKPGAELTEEQQKIKDLLSDANLFGELKYEGTEDVMGDSAYHYSGSLDSEAVIEFLKEGAAIEGSAPSEAELDELREALNDVDFDADIWIGVDDMILRKISGELNVTPEDGGSVAMTLSYSMGNINEPVTIEVPEGAESLETMLEGMMGGMMGGGL